MDDATLMVLMGLQNPPSSTTKISAAKETSGNTRDTEPLKLTPTIVVDGLMVALDDITG